MAKGCGRGAPSVGITWEREWGRKRGGGWQCRIPHPDPPVLLPQALLLSKFAGDGTPSVRGAAAVEVVGGKALPGQP